MVDRYVYASLIDLCRNVVISYNKYIYRNYKFNEKKFKLFFNKN